MTDHDHDDSTNELGEFTRRKIKIQLGDGPDQRGEVTVEEVRDAGQGFADFVLEADRVTDLLIEKLGLEVENVEVDVEEIESDGEEDADE